ncbi:MAG: hypothetical protein E7019_06545 [Alphaproteobacteria bacterium]|nr:hypothetical protein [Alphaproteobacteria bacterium]
MRMGRISFILICLLLISFGAKSQVFGDKTISSDDATKFVSEDDSEKIQTDEELEKKLKEEKALAEQERIESEMFVPGGGLDIINRPTEDGSVRGGATVVEVDEKGNSRAAEKIFLYYENFKVYGGNNPYCDVRFFVLANLNRKLNALDVKLVWPDMTTTLSFSDVSPNMRTYYDYTLMGEGCYSMDKMPNIVVNRCRVKGMSSVECANKIVWLNKSSGK